jgi:hypothetical protein
MPQSEPAGERVRPHRRRRRLLGLGWLRGLIFGGLLAVLIAALGFVAFASSVPAYGNDDCRLSRRDRRAHRRRFAHCRCRRTACAGRGKRLLISGVNPTTTPEELTRVNPDFERLLDCCIDLGHDAANTIGNAVETGRWVRDRNFRSLIVVTSGWHMPRALIEIENELPDVRLIPYPVVSDRMRDEDWWSDALTVRLLLIEYVKYIASYLRVRLDPAQAAGNPRQSQS